RRQLPCMEQTGQTELLSLRCKPELFSQQWQQQTKALILIMLFMKRHHNQVQSGIIFQTMLSGSQNCLPTSKVRRFLMLRFLMILPTGKLFIWQRSEEHTSELQSREISYAVFCLNK